MDSYKSPLITCAVLSLMYFSVFSQKAFALRNYNNHPDLAKAMEFDPEMNGDMEKADRSKAEFHYLRYLKDIQDPNESFQRARVYCQLGAMYAVSFNREKGEEMDIDKAREFYKKVLDNEPNRIDCPTIMTRMAFIGSKDPKSKMGRIKDRVEFYKWIASFDDNKIRKFLLPLTANPKDPSVRTTTLTKGIKDAIESFNEVVIGNSVDDALAMEVPEEGLFYIMDQLPPDASERKRVDVSIARRKKDKASSNIQSDLKARNNELRISIPQASNTELRMSIITTIPQEAKGIPVFHVTVENVGDKDTVLNLGMMLAKGKVHLPTKIRLILTDSRGETKELYFADKRYPAVVGRIDDFAVPLRVGSAYTLRLSLDSFWCPKTKEFQIELKDGVYRISSELTGTGAQHINGDMEGIKLMKFWKGNLQSDVTVFRIGK